jgi:hypothetical protein
MPALEMRGRYLMREYWGDSALFTKLTADERELYQGLWMLADDSGWMPRDITGIAAALYRFEDGNLRESRVRAGIDRLRRLGKVESHRCGCLFMPAVARYPRSGRKSAVWEANHQNHSNPAAENTKTFKGIQRDSNPSPVPSLPDLTGRAPARGNGESFEEKISAHGGKKP